MEVEQSAVQEREGRGIYSLIIGLRRIRDFLGEIGKTLISPQKIILTEIPQHHNSDSQLFNPSYPP